jgi:prepilin-type N-terminal cleavage/methylation domain-containing protein
MLSFFGKFHKNKKSFTLIELLIVIAILALLMSIIIITLNPSEILKQTRDTKRISNLKSINNALSIFQATRSSASMGTSSIIYISIPDSSTTCANLGLPALPDGYTYACSTTANYKKTDGTGWIPVNFDSLDIGSPISSLPIDPTNTTSTGLYYTYITGGSWELNAFMESLKQRISGGEDKTSTDGGDSHSIFEIGTDLNLSPNKDTGLVGYWKFDDYTSGSIVNSQTIGLKDSSGYNNNATAYNTNGTGMSFVDGKIGGAVRFDGTDDYLSLPHAGGSAITMVFWVKWDWDGISRGRFTKKGGSAASDGNFILVGGGTQDFGLYLGGGLPSAGFHSTTNGGITEGNYHYIVWTYDKITLKIYINGVLKKEVAVARTTDFSSDSIYLGAPYGVDTEDFKGDMDEVRIYNRVLSAAEVVALYNSTR